ncbi:MAG: ornithine cyclodeaminase family protein [Bowdeniella nasicola]|nr:ornithine cyclodeaminase family protein [Bowdeniella nasicola]
MTGQLPYLSSEDIAARVGPREARELLAQALVEFDPATDPARSNVAAGAGHLLLMPSTIGEASGVKIACVAPDNPDRGLPRIQALYCLLDSATLTPRAIIDGSALTSLRTPAMSAVAADSLADQDAEVMLVVGSGPQAVSHVRAMAEIRDLTRIVMTARDTARLNSAVEGLVREGYPVEAGRASDASEADIIVCATSGREPVIADDDVAAGACVVAMGSHEPDCRELPSALMGRSLVVVEDHETALREAGDVIQAIADGSLSHESLATVRDVVLGRVTRRSDAPNVFKGVGMSWQDLAVAAGAARAVGLDFGA